MTVATDCELVLEVLRRSRGEWVPHLYAQTGVMVHSRIPELRKRGYDILCRRFGKRDYRYKLVAEPAQAKETLCL